jgi:hydroxyethylthiazole kinase
MGTSGGTMGYASGAAARLAEIRASAPRIHCITNLAANVLTANVLLAIGAVPSLTLAQEEVGDFVAGSDALLVNLGTLDAERRAAIPIAIEAAARASRPWVLDPVFANRSPGRLRMALSLSTTGPAVIRANSAEVSVMVREMGIGGDEGDVAALAHATASCVAMTGRRDLICAEERSAEIANGHALMDKVTAMGCSLGAVLAAFCAVEEDSFAASAQALLVFGIAGEIAGNKARGPGSFVPEFLDALYNLDETAIQEHAAIT